MEKKLFDTSNTMLTHLTFGQFAYDPKNVRFEAVQITRDNIGKLAMEFEAELKMFPDEGMYYFEAMLARADESAGVEFEFAENDWIFPIGNEIQVWTNEMFRNTFEPKSGAWPEESVRVLDHVNIDMMGPDKNGLPFTSVKELGTSSDESQPWPMSAP